MLTFSGYPLNKKLVAVITIADNSLTGTSPTLAIANTTPGVDATHRSAPEGTLLVDTATGIPYINQGVPGAPVWTKVSGT